jgi:hypothetical protein
MHPFAPEEWEMIKYLVLWDDWDDRRRKCNVQNLDELFPTFFQKAEVYQIQLKSFFFKIMKVYNEACIFDFYFNYYNSLISEVLSLQESPADAFPLFRISFEIILVRSFVSTAQGLEQGLVEPVAQHQPYLLGNETLESLHPSSL